MKLSRSLLRNMIISEGLSHQCKKRNIVVGNTRCSVEIADSEILRNKGLMFRKSMDEDQGMFFIFPDVSERGFWMKNTHIPLSIAFIDELGCIINIENMTPYDLNSKYSSHPAKYALEMNAGWFEKNNIYPGDKISI